MTEKRIITAAAVTTGEKHDGKQLQNLVENSKQAGIEVENIMLGVCNDLKNRGVKDILIAFMDGLKGLPDAIKAVFPEVNIQSCIIQQIRNSIKYVSYKNKKEVVRDLKLIYKAPTEEIALTQLDSLKEKWNNKYPMIMLHGTTTEISYPHSLLTQKK